MSSVIFWVISVLALTGVILASKYQVEWLTQALTFGGIIASAFGVKMSFSQIKNVKDIAEETIFQRPSSSYRHRPHNR